MSTLAFFMWFLAASPLTFKLAPSGATPGTYTNPVVTIDSRGRTTSAQNGRPLSYVNAMDFGPSGTGSTTDDTAELQAAINATPEGGALYLPAGLYLVSSTLTCSRSIHIFGDGFNSAIYLAPWFPTNQDVLKFSAASVKSGVHLERFAIYPHPGYSGEKPGRHAITFDCSGSSGWSSVLLDQLYCEARNGTSINIDNSDGDTTTVNGMTVQNCVLFGGVQATKVGAAFRLLNNLIAYSASGNSNSYTGITLSVQDAASDASIDGNFVSSFGGISASGSNVKIRGNAIRYPGVTNTFTTNLVWIGSSTNADVRGNTIDTMLSGSTFYGINISSGSSGARIGPNWFPTNQWSGKSSSMYLDAGSSTVFEVDGDVYSSRNNTFLPNVTNLFGGDVIFTNGVTIGGIRRTNWASGVGGTNLSIVYVNMSTQVDGPSFNDSSEIAASASTTNVTFSLRDGSIETNRISTQFHQWVESPKGVNVDAGVAKTLEDSGEILFTMSGIDKAIAGVVDMSVEAWKLGTNFTYQGDIFVRGSSGWTNLQKGTLGQVLTMGASLPAWQTPSGGGGAGGLGTNLFVNGTLIQPAKLTNYSGIRGGLVWSTNANGDIQAYAANTDYGFGTGATNDNGTVKAALAPGSNVTFTTNVNTITINSSSVSLEPQNDSIANLLLVTTSETTDTHTDTTYRDVTPTARSGMSATIPADKLITGAVLKVEISGELKPAATDPQPVLKLVFDGPTASDYTITWVMNEPASSAPTLGTTFTAEATIVIASTPSTVRQRSMAIWGDGATQANIPPTAGGWAVMTTGQSSNSLDTSVDNTVKLQYAGMDANMSSIKITSLIVWML